MAKVVLEPGDVFKSNRDYGVILSEGLIILLTENNKGNTTKYDASKCHTLPGDPVWIQHPQREIQDMLLLSIIKVLMVVADTPTS
jgi:hypothetical protein